MLKVQWQHIPNKSVTFTHTILINNNIKIWSRQTFGFPFITDTLYGPGYTLLNKVVLLGLEVVKVQGVAGGWCPVQNRSCYGDTGNHPQLRRGTLDEIGFEFCRGFFGHCAGWQMFQKCQIIRFPGFQDPGGSGFDLEIITSNGSGLQK